MKVKHLTSAFIPILLISSLVLLQYSCSDDAVDEQSQIDDDDKDDDDKDGNDDNDDTPPDPSSEKNIRTFMLERDLNTALSADITGVINIDDLTISAEVPPGISLTTLSPSIEISEGASVSPPSGDAQDFTDPVTYTVTAEDESTQEYRVTITQEPVPDSDEKDLLTFSFLGADNAGFDSDISGIINQQTGEISVSFSFYVSTTGLVPSITISDLATVTPASGVVKDFTNPVTYTVTAQDASSREYTVTVSSPPSNREVLIQLYNANPGNTLGWDLDNDDITTWSGVAAFGKNGPVTQLTLRNKGITALPPEIQFLDGLTALYLEDNTLTSLPAEIGGMLNLGRLELENNDLVTLPVQIGDLQWLDYLDLTGNELTAIPSEIGSLTRLKSLYLRGNKLTSIPEQIGDLENLLYLDLAENELISIPAEIGNLTQLQNLNLFNNQLSDVPDAVCDLQTTGTTLTLDDSALCSN